MKKSLLAFALIILSTAAFSQRSVSHKIIRNRPDSVNNAMIYFAPLMAEFSKPHFAFGFAVGGSYLYNDQLMFEADFRHNYTEKTNFLGYFADKRRHVNENFYGEGAEGVKPMLNYDVTLMYLPFRNYKERKMKVVLREIGNVKEYVKLPALRFVSVPLRLGFGHYRANTGTKWMMDSRSFTYTGYAKSDPTKSLEAVEGSTMFYANTLNLGVGLFVRDDLKVNFKGAYNGTKDIRATTLYYFDVLLPVSQKLDDMHVVKRIGDANQNSLRNYTYVVNDDTPMAPVGFRVGMKVRYMKKINGGWTAEVGFRPGPVATNHNLYILMGMEVNFSTLTKHYRNMMR